LFNKAVESASIESLPVPASDMIVEFACG